MLASVAVTECFLFALFCFVGAEDRTRGLDCVKRVLYH